jgi:hypothetical protein
MNLDLGGVLPQAAAPVADDDKDIARLVAVLMEMQAGINMLTDIIGQQKAKIVVLERDVALLKARTDAPKRPVILEAGPWRN